MITLTINMCDGTTTVLLKGTPNEIDREYRSMDETTLVGKLVQEILHQALSSARGD